MNNRLMKAFKKACVVLLISLSAISYLSFVILIVGGTAYILDGVLSDSINGFLCVIEFFTFSVMAVVFIDTLIGDD